MPSARNWRQYNETVWLSKTLGTPPVIVSFDNGRWPLEPFVSTRRIRRISTGDEGGYEAVRRKRPPFGIHDWDSQLFTADGCTEF